jgi:glycerol-1-phosphate dehydrogenase [NAD(P)+]
MLAHTIEVERLLRPYAAELTTQCLLLEQGLLERSGHILGRQLAAGPWLVVADETTWQVAGETAFASLLAAGAQAQRYTVEPGPGETTPVADDAKVAALTEKLHSSGSVAAVAIGAGTVNDIVKTATTNIGLPYAVIATAPSMNGYTSSLSALLSNGVKITQPCRPPVACLVDLDIMAAAPYRMIASGLGDLMSKPVANADWRLAYRLLGAEYATRAMPLTEAGGALLDGVAEKLPSRDVDAVGRLCASLCVSGLAMGLAGTSAPSSGGEHLISHYLDMTHFAWGEPHDFHGCQVGVATVTTAALYERLAALDPDQIDVETRVAQQPGWDEYELEVRSRFGTLADAVIDHAERAHPSPAQLRERLQLLKRDWEVILGDVGQTLRSSRSLTDELRRAQCPDGFAAIKVTPQRAQRAITHSKDIRDRYTILHLAADMGLLERWTGDLLAVSESPR